MTLSVEAQVHDQLKAATNMFWADRPAAWWHLWPPLNQANAPVRWGEGVARAKNVRFD